MASATGTQHRSLSTPSSRPRPTGRAELWWWLFMRVSGIALLFLAVGHVLIMHVLDDGIERVNFGFVAARWQNPLWRTWDWLLLSLALIHGLNGLRVIIQDYVRRPLTRSILNRVFAVITAATFVLGTIVVFTFDPSKWAPQ